MTAQQWVPTHQIYWAVGCLMLVFGVPPVLPSLDLGEGGIMVSAGVFWCKMNGARLLVQRVCFADCYRELGHQTGKEVKGEELSRNTREHVLN